MQPATRSSNQPNISGGHRLLPSSGELRPRLLFHHLPIAVASLVVLALFMNLLLFHSTVYPHVDILSGTFPQERAGGMDDMDHDDDQAAAMESDEDHGSGRDGAMEHGGGQDRSADHSGDRDRSMDHGDDQAGAMENGRGEGHGADSLYGRSIQPLTVATGYVALGLLAISLLIGPANLLLGRRNPVSSYLRRDVGIWTAIFSVVHVIFGLQVHGSGRIRGFLDYFVAPDGGLLTTSFGLGNWTGLAALVIVVGLLAISSDLALRKLKARPWKRIQQLNYALFILVLLHAFFYGALVRLESPFTLLLAFTVIVVFVGQAVGFWLWRQRQARRAARHGQQSAGATG